MPVTSDHAMRREALFALLENGPIRNQKALVDALRARDFDATQSSVSRDLKTIGAIKTIRGYELPAGQRDTDRLIGEVADLIRTIQPAGGNLLVLRTAIGAAQRVALALDRSDWPEIIGNIGGDDTVFIATPSKTAQGNLVARIEHIRHTGSTI